MINRKKIFFLIVLFFLFFKSLFYCENFENLKRIYEYNHLLPLNPEIYKPVEKGNYYEYKIYYNSLNNERVPALLILPRVTEDNKKFGPPWPVVFVMHFHGSDKTLANMIADNFVKFGIALFSIDGVYKGERAKPGKDPLTLDPQESVKNLKQQIFDILRGVDFLETQKEIDKNRIGFFGVSLGAITGAVATAVDKRFKYVVLADGAADLYTLFKYSDGAHEGSILKIREYLLEKNYRPENLRNIYKEVDPLYFVSHISPRPLLLQNGRKDTTMSIQAIKILHQTAREPKKIIWYDTDHILPFDLVALDSLKFFYSNFRNEKIKTQFSWIEDEKIRGIFLKNLSEVEKFKSCGINTVFCNLKISSEEEKKNFEKISKELNLFLIVKYLGREELGNIKDFPKYIPGFSGYPSSSTPCPGNLSFWKKNVIEKILKFLNFYKDFSGILIDFEMEGDKTYYKSECVCDDCFSRYLEKIKKKEDLKNIPFNKRIDFLKKNNYFLDYREEQKKRINQIIISFIRQAQRINPNLIFGFLGYENNWFYNAVLEGLSKSGSPVLILPTLNRDKGFSKNLLTFSKRLQKENENFVLIPGISLEYFFPEEIPGLIDKIGIDFSGYYLTYEYLDKDYLEKIKIANQELVRITGEKSPKIKFKTPVYSGIQNILPKVAVVYSGFNDYAYREVYHRALQEFEVPFDEYENSNFPSLIYNLNDYDAILTTPFWNKINTFDLSIYREEIIKFLKGGGIFSVFDANSEENIFWLKKFGRDFYLEIEKCSGKIGEFKKHPIFKETNIIENLNCGDFHFTNFSKSWDVICECNEKKPFFLLQNIGRGVISVSNSLYPPALLMENFWEYLKRQRAGVILKDLEIDQNKIYLTILNTGDRKKIKITYGTRDERFEKILLLEKEEEKEVELSYKLKKSGRTLFYFIFSDLKNQEVYERKVYLLNIPNILQINTDKSFYTDEKEIKIFIRISEENNFLKDKRIVVKLNGKKKEIPAKKFNEISFEINSIPEGKILIEVEIFGKEKIASETLEVFKLRTVPGMVKINYARGGILEVDNREFFPIGIYSIPEDELKEVKEAGFNCTVNYITSPTLSLSYLDKAEKAGIKVIPYAIYPQNMIEEKEEKELKEFLELRKTHPALLAWYLVDEPELNNQSPQLINKLNKFVKEKDPYHPTTLVIANSEKYRDYAESSDIFMIDPYPIPGGELEGKIEEVYKLTKKAKNSLRIFQPLWCIPQSFDWAVWNGRFKKGDRERPTPEELRNMTYQAIVGGAKGIIYWAYRASRYYIRDYPTTWEGLKKVVSELNYLKDVLLSQDFKEGEIFIKPSSLIAHLIKQYNRKIYLFVVNLTRKEKKLKFSLPFAKDSEINVLFENRKIYLKNRGFEDIFKPIEVHIYEISLD